jgi:phosphoribosylformylglycinamidine synthase
MNFGNPQRPDIMGQFVGCIEGMREACLALDYPVVSGNVSLYNETNGRGILPTPVIGGVGLLADVAAACSIAFKAPGETLLLIGTTPGPDGGHLGASIYLREIAGREDGPPPPVDLAAERRNGDFVRGLIEAGHVTACHDLSDGGLLVAAAEMAMAGGIGAALTAPDGLALDYGWLFGEDQARYLVTCPGDAASGVVAEAAAADVPILVLGETGGAQLTLPSGHTISVDELKTAHESWLPGYMSGD